MRRKRQEVKRSPSAAPEELVAGFLRAQNLEQIGRYDEAIELYESVVEAGFDAAGPYDRLIFIYGERGLHSEVIRVAEASLRSVKTYPQKKEWYERQIESARRSLGEISPSG